MMSNKHPSRRSSWVIVMAIVAAFVAGGLVGSIAASNDPKLPQLGPEQRTASQDVAFSGTFSPIVKKVRPAVVSITAEKVIRTRGLPAPFFFGPFEDFFGDRFGPEERRAQGLGSGVIVSPDGYILTNQHVIDSAEQITVHLDDDREFRAQVVGADSKTDIALLKVEAGGLPVATLGNSENIEVGDIVLAVGSPFGLRQTVTMGIVGATGRGGLGIERYEDFIQTDAAINPGNSGGALVNTQGELIGVNTAIVSRTGGNQGIGFAVPINMAHHVMTQLLEHGRVVRGYIGVGIQDLTKELAKQFGASETKGALVRNVEPGSPADKAGLARGDIIVEVDGTPVEDSRSLSLRIAAKAPGATVQLTVLRESERRTVSVTLAEYPEEGETTAESRGGESGVLQGLAVDNLSPAVARQLGLDPDTQGVVVVQVRPGSPADRAGLQRGDVIEEVARQPVSNVMEFREAVRNAGGGSVLLLVNRSGNPLFIVVEPE